MNISPIGLVTVRRMIFKIFLKMELGDIMGCITKNLWPGFSVFWGKSASDFFHLLRGW